MSNEVLEKKIAKQAQELAILNKALAEKNRELDAMHYVWCDGGCQGGVHRYTKEALTEDVVERAERNTKRLRTWLENRKYRDSYEAKPPEGGLE